MDLPELSQEQLQELLNEALAQRAQDDSPSGFSAFFELLHKIPLNSAGKRWIEKAYEAHENGRGFLNKAHRESAKTTVFAKFFLAFRIGHDPEKSNLVVRINDDKANETTQEVANIIEHNEKWEMVFPNVVPDKQKGWGANGYEVKRIDINYRQWTEIKTKMPPDPSFVGRGWKSGSIIGSRVNGILLIDDIHDEANTSSDRQLRAVKKFYTDTLNQVLMSEAWEVWNYTPWTTNDLYAYAENTGAYELCVTPLLERVPENDEKAEAWPKDEFVPLSGGTYHRYWPEMWPWDRITKKYKVSGAIGFARMYLLDLEATKGVNLKKEWLHYYPADQIDRSWPVYMGVDYASTMDKIRDKERDYFTIAICRAIPGGGIVIFDGVRRHVSKGEAIKAVGAYANMYPELQLIGVENIGKGEEFYNDLLLSKDMTGRVLPLMEVSHGRRSKGDRFENWLAPRCQSGRIWFSSVENEFLRHFHDEWLTWPSGEHDDCLDAVYMCAVAAEGALPSKAERTGGRKLEETTNPFHSLKR